MPYSSDQYDQINSRSQPNTPANMANQTPRMMGTAQPMPRNARQTTARNAQQAAAHAAYNQAMRTANQPLPNAPRQAGMPQYQGPAMGMPTTGAARRSAPSTPPARAPQQPSVASQPFMPGERPARENECNLPLAMAWFEDQVVTDMYSPDHALERGTLFPELDKPWLPQQGGR